MFDNFNSIVAIIGLVLIALEFVVTGVYLIWWGIAMAVAGLIGKFIPSLPNGVIML